MNREKISERLRNLRGKKTLKVVCDDLGISDSALSAYELGKRTPTDGRTSKASGECAQKAKNTN